MCVCVSLAILALQVRRRPTSDTSGLGLMRASKIKDDFPEIIPFKIYCVKKSEKANMLINTGVQRLLSTSAQFLHC